MKNKKDNILNEGHKEENWNKYIRKNKNIKKKKKIGINTLEREKIK